MKTTKKLLSVFLAVIMLMSSMSVCFGTVSFAAGGTATADQWNALYAALKADSVKNAAFSTDNGKYTVDDPDGNVLKAVEAYFNVFNTLANKEPATGNPNNTSNTTGSTEGNRVIQQVNASIESYVKANMPGYEASMSTFIKNIIGTNSVSTSTGSTLTVGGSSNTTDNKNLPTNNLSDVAPINLTVVLSSAITSSTLDTLPDSVVTEKTFTVTHAKDRYDYTYATGSTGGCNSKTTYTRTYKFYYYISGVSSTDGSAISTEVIKNSAAVLQENAGYFSMDLDALVAVFDAEALGKVKKAVVDAKNAVVNAFSGSVYNHFFSAYNVEALSALIDKAVEIVNASKTALYLYDKVAAGYDGIITNRDALVALSNDIKGKSDAYDGYASDVKAYVESHEYEGKTFNRAAVTTFYNDVLREIELVELRNLKATIEDTVPEYYTYNEENVTDGTVLEDGTVVNSTVTGAKLDLAIGTLNGWIESIGTYDKDNVVAVWGENDIVGVLTSLRDNLSALKALAGHNENFAKEVAKYIKEVYQNTNIGADSASLLSAIKNYDSWYTGVKKLIGDIEAAYNDNIADAVIEGHDAVMRAHLDSKYTALHARVAAQIDAAKVYYDLLAETGSVQANIVNLETFAYYEQAFKVIERDVYEFLLASVNFDMPAETKAKYDALSEVSLEDYYNFYECGGFKNYYQTEIPDIVRPEADDTHDAHKGDFTVTDEKINGVIDTIENLLADEEVKKVLGSLINKDKETGEPTGEPFDIATLVNGLIDGLFTDDLINTIMGFLYPAVTKEFAKVWAGLPESITVEDVDTGMFGLKADVVAYLDLYTCEKATHAIGMSIFPIELAEKLRTDYGTKYEAVAAVLDDVTVASSYQLNGEGDDDDTYNGDPWKDEKLFVNVLDENGDPVLDEDGTNKTKLNFAWGIAEAEDKRKAFIDAAVAALSGLEPLLLALLSNQYYESTNKIGTGSGSASVMSVPLNLSVDPIDLKFMVSSNAGYNNVLAPVFELLGVEAPNGNNLTTTRKVLEDGLFAPLDAFIAKLAADPLETILEVIPNAMYAIKAERILPLLDMLKIDIEYTTNASYKVLSGLASGSMNDVYKSEEPIKINVKDMINLEDMGLDLSFDGIWSMVTDALNNGGEQAEDGEEVEGGEEESAIVLPKPDASYLATLGELTWKDTKRSEWTYTYQKEAGKAAYIEANKADVLIYLLRYVLNTLGENPDLLASFGLELSDDVKAIIAGATANPDKTIAAIVELFNQSSFDTLKDYVWYVSELNEDTVVGMTPALHQYLGYDNNWTKETATYIIENVDEIIGAVMKMVGGEDAEPFSLTATLGGLIDGLFTNANITALAKLLANLDLNALLAGGEEAEPEEGTEEEIETADEGEETTEPEASAADFNALVDALTGIDLSAFAAYADLADDATWGFEDGNKEGFAAALVNLLAPLEPVLNFILKGENLTVLGDVELYGYNGYETAIVPLLEALGAAPAALGEDGSALEAVLTALIERVDAIAADPVEEILGLIPSVLYFLKSDGLTTAVRNLLQPVLVIIETIDPVYALNLNELLSGLTADLGFSINLNDLSFAAIFDIIGAVTGLDLAALEEIIDDVCEVITVSDYTSASSFVGTGKKGAYGEYFDSADLVTVVLSFALTWALDEDNADALATLIAGDDAEMAAEIKKYIGGAAAVIGGIEPEYLPIDWDYNFPENYDDSIFESGLTIQPTINTIKYLTNWTEDTAKYVDENLDAIVADVLKATGSEYASVAELIEANVNIYSKENVDAIVKVVADLLVDIDQVLIDTAGVVLGADINALLAYEAPEISTGAEFAAALSDVLATIKPVVDWLLFGEDYAFFSQNGKDLITIKGAEGYAYGLAPILEALGVDAPAKDEATVKSILEATFERVDEILADPVNKAVDLLPNIIYFLNANGVSVSVQNLLAGVTGLTNTVSEKFGIDLDLMSIFNDLINGLLPEGSAVTLDVTNLDLESIFTLVQELIGLDLTPVADILVDLCVGNIVVYTSASGEYGFKMQYNDEFARYDMLTIIATCLIQAIKLESNEEALKEMVGEDAYNGIIGVLSVEKNVPVQDFSWALTDKADTGEVFSPIKNSELYADFQYGEIYTKEMEQYISDSFGAFVDNIIYLLGLELNGKTVRDFTDLITGAVGGSVYSSSVINTVKGALTGLVDTLSTSIPAGGHIINILAKAGVADLNAIAEVEVPEFKDDKAMFISQLCNVLEPIYPVLEWLLADADITFFVDENEDKIITLHGAEGYAYGIIPLLEAFSCEGVLTTAEYYEAIENGKKDVLLTSILNPLLDRVDEILLNPAEELLEILPNLIYFINSDGVDTVVKNTLNAVNTLLTAIEPITKKDLYGLFGLDLDKLTFEELFNNYLLGFIKDATGYELESISVDTLTELSVGTLESYTSANGKTAYRMVYQGPEAKGEMVTTVLRLAVTFITLDDTLMALLDMIEKSTNMDPATKEYLKGVLLALAECVKSNDLGMELALSTLYYIYYGAYLGVDGVVNGYDDLNQAWKDAIADLEESSPAAAALLKDIIGWDIFEDVLDVEEGLAPNGFIAFFQKIKAWFEKIVEWFKNLFAAE